MKAESKLIEIGLIELSQFAKEIAQKLRPQNVVCLYGELGTGKTTLAQFIIKYLVENHDQYVTSPTFNLVNIYDSDKGKIWHFDLYRINKLSDVYELGYEEALSTGITIIEWPQIIEPILPKNGVIKVFLEYSKDDEDKRDMLVE